MYRPDYKLSVVVPAYNEEAVLDLFYQKMTEVLKGFGCDYELIFVDDGSADATWAKLAALSDADARVVALRFARNFGHQTAVTAGMDAATGDAVVVIDADLQDPPEVIGEMIERWKEGYDVVYGKRLKREGESFLKKFTAAVYYRLLHFMSASDIPLDTGDFRLLDRQVVDAMCAMREHNRFLRGLSAWTGFSQCAVEYVRHERAAGSTKYTLKKMLRLAGDGIIGFSSKPLTLSFWVGCGVCSLTLCAMLALLIVQIVRGFSLLPWVFALLFLLIGGVFVALGAVGAYLARVYDEVKGRPLYLLSEEKNRSLRS